MHDPNDPPETVKLDDEARVAGVDVDDELGEAIAKGVNSSRFASSSRVALLEAGPDYYYYEPALGDDDLLQKLHEIDSSKAVPAKMRTFVIPWSSLPGVKRDHVFAVTSTALFKLCSMIAVSPLFLEQVLENIYWSKHGTGLFQSHDDQGKALNLELFYRYSFGLATGRSFIYTKYDFNDKVTTNICVNFNPKSLPLLMKLTKSSFDDPFSIHTLLLSQTLDAWIQEGSKYRGTLIKNENGPHDPNPKLTTLSLHRLSQQFHIVLEDINDLEDRIVLTHEAHEMFRRDSKYSFSATRASKLAYLVSKCRTTKRWIANYKDRTNIRINLAFHLSTQVDNDLNVQISKATTTLAKDAQRDSSSMITIAAVTMFFLPGTFISAVFSMTFFNFQQDELGNQQFQVSTRWWYFLAATLPLTVLVFTVWIVWQKIRARRFEREDLLEGRREEKVEQPALEMEYGEEGVVPVEQTGGKRRMGIRAVLPFMRKRNQ